MFDKKIKSKIIYWLAKSLTPYEFPDEPLKKDIANQNYCKNYPSLLSIKNNLSSSREFIDSIQERNQKVKIIFSLRNIYFILAATYVTIYRFLYLLSFICLCLLIFNVFDRDPLILLFCILFIFGLIVQAMSKTYIYYLNYNNIISFCILHSFYIYQDLSNIKNLERDMKIKRIVKKIIEKLSELFYLLGKFEQDRLGIFASISKGIIWRKSWLNSPQDTTINDLRDYFGQITYCLIVGKSGNIPIDNPLLYGQNSIQNWQYLTNSMDRSVSFAKKILVLGESIRKIFVLIKSFFI